MSKKSLDQVTFIPPLRGTLGEIKNITIPVPKPYKEKFSELQRQSSREFGKYLRDLICAAIDNNAESEAS